MSNHELKKNIMLRHNLIISIRNILKRKFISSVIFVSLTIGFVCSFYITGFIYNELTTDKFNKNDNHIFGLLSDNPQSPEKKISMIVDGVPQYIKQTYPEVTDYCQVGNQSIDKIKIGENNYFSEFRIIEASPSFFTFFSFPLISGNAENVLSATQKVVVSKQFAQKYFGNIDVIGKSIEMKINGTTFNLFTISGVFDNSHVNSHLTFDMAISNVNKDIRGTFAYLLLDQSVSPDEFGRKLLKGKKDIPSLFSDIPMNYYLQDLKSIYFQPYWESRIVKSRNIQTIYIAIIIGLLVLLVAIFNYINLIYFQLIDRTKEIVIKKIIGAKFLQSGRQLFTECILLIGISALLAIALLKQSFLFFNRLTETEYMITDFLHSTIVIIDLIIISSIVLISWLLIYRDINKQKSFCSLNFSRMPKIRNKSIPLLIVFQFAASLILIVSALTIVKQVNYIHNKDIGLDKSAIELSLGVENDKKTIAFRDELRKYPAIENVSVCEGSPMRGVGKVIINYVENKTKKMFMPSIYSGDHEYINVSGIKILEGEQFSENSNNNINKCLINKTMADFLGPKNPIGRLLPGTENEIIGITNDFIWLSLDNPVEPAYITYSEKGADLLIKLNPELQKEGISNIKQCWARLIPDSPIEYNSLGDIFNSKHEKQEHLVKLITTFCFLSIFISLIGLLSLSLFTTQLRTKEIGIRKVNGAKIIEITILLNKNIIQWILFAIIIATPIAWYFMHKWLQNFAYKTELNWWIFALAGLMALCISTLTVCWHSWKAAGKNPVEALRYE